MEPKWLYRLEYKDSSNGLWYNGYGEWCFESGIGLVDGCQTKTLPMAYDWRYKQDGMDWFSSCSNVEDLLHWYSEQDAKELMERGFVFTRYLATEYHAYENETVFIKETAIKREEIDFFDLMKKKFESTGFSDAVNKPHDIANARAFEAYPVRCGTMPFCLHPQDANESLRMCYKEGYLQALEDVRYRKIEIDEDY